MRESILRQSHYFCSLLLFGIGSGLSGDEALLSHSPVDNLPDVLEVLGSCILIVQVVSVLPDVDADNGHEVGANVSDRVLVVGLTVGEHISALVVDEPAPAGALDSSSPLIESLAELVNRSP